MTSKTNKTDMIAGETNISIRKMMENPLRYGKVMKAVYRATYDPASSHIIRICFSDSELTQKKSMTPDEFDRLVDVLEESLSEDK
jgi:hypothetical protein